MGEIKKKLSGIAALALAIMAFFLFLPSRILAQEDGELEKIFYYSTGSAGIRSLRDNAAKIDIFAPQAYVVNSKLRISGGLSREIKDIVAKNDLQVMPLVMNQGFNQKIMSNLLASEKTQDAVIAYLISEAKKNNYIGWQFDFEHIYYLDRDRFTNFVKKTGVKFRENNLMLSIAAVARKNDTVNSYYKNWSGAFDYEKISREVDFISIMTYDDPNSVGPVASLFYVEEVLKYLDGKVPDAKLSLGVPLYSWDWYKTTKRAIGHGAVQAIRKNYVCREDFDQNLGVTWVSYSAKGIKRKTWYEDEKSFELKFKVARENELRGISAWVLGMEDPDIWNKI